MSRNERRALIAAAAAIGLSMTPAEAARLVEPTCYAEMRQLVEAHPEIEHAIIPGLSAAPLLMGEKKAGLKPQDVFNISLWTGTGAARTITTGIDSGEGSLVWVKKRNSATTSWNLLFDTLRGAGSFLSSEQTAAQATQMAMLSSFSSDGYGLGANAYVNGNGSAYVGWQFREANKFFKIVQYTGNGVAGRQVVHNLGIKPGLLIVKRIDSNESWAIYHRGPWAVYWAEFNNSIFQDSINWWNNTEPTSSEFTLGSHSRVNQNGGQFIAYLFAHDPSADGIIQCGSIPGSAGDSAVTLGWKPQYLLLKTVNSSDPWLIVDSARGANSLFPSTNGAESIYFTYSFTSTGFTIQSFGATINFVYMAIREAA